MQPSDTQEVGNLQECHYQEIADFLASSEEGIHLQEDLSVASTTDDMLLVRQRVQELKIRVPIDASEVIKWHLLVQEDKERLLFQAMRYSEEFNSFVLKDPATPNQLLCNYVIWYATTLGHENQDHVSEEELGAKRKHNLSGVKGGSHRRQRKNTSSSVSEQISNPQVMSTTSDISSASLVPNLSTTKSITSAPTNNMASSVQVTSTYPTVPYSFSVRAERHFNHRRRK